MRISDWSSDVCSSDLRSGFWLPDVWRTVAEGGHGAFGAVRGKQAGFEARLSPSGHVAVAAGPAGRSRPLGARGICRRRPADDCDILCRADHRSEEHTSELQSLMRISYSVFLLK